MGASVIGKCREDAPASCEGCLSIKLRLPLLDCFVGNLLASAFDGLDRKGVDDVEDVGSDTLGDLQHPPQRFRAEHRRLTQRRVAQDWDCQGFELFVCSPAVQRELLEPAGQLHIAADCLARLVDAKAAERDPQTVAEKAKGVEDDALLAIGSGENVVHLVDHHTCRPIASMMRNAACYIWALSTRGRCGAPSRVSSSA